MSMSRQLTFTCRPTSPTKSKLWPNYHRRAKACQDSAPKTTYWLSSPTSKICLILEHAEQPQFVGHHPIRHIVAFDIFQHMEDPPYAGRIIAITTGKKS